jgi:dTDP-glucose pyrophosphorylase
MQYFNHHLVITGTLIKDALFSLNTLGGDSILFVVSEKNILLGSLTDGDVRRGLLRGIDINDKIDRIIQSHPKYLRKGDTDIIKIIDYRNNNLRILPVLDEENKVVDIVNFRKVKSYLPVDVVIMAGGKGKRLRPLTNSVPKPLLMVGDKPIIEHNIDRLLSYGIQNFWLSVRYLGELIEEYFGNGEEKKINMKYVWEKNPLGTIGAVAKIHDFQHDYILVTNSDILTDLDYEQFFKDFVEQDADFSVVTIPFKVNVPYAVLETRGQCVTGFTEKPTYTYYSNGGIYLMKKSMVELIPKSSFYNTTDLMENLIRMNKKVITFALSGYWLDVGKPDDYEQAQQDIKNLVL